MKWGAHTNFITLTFSTDIFFKLSCFCTQLFRKLRVSVILTTLYSSSFFYSAKEKLIIDKSRQKCLKIFSLSSYHFSEIKRRKLNASNPSIVFLSYFLISVKSIGFCKVQSTRESGEHVFYTLTFILGVLAFQNYLKEKSTTFSEEYWITEWVPMCRSTHSVWESFHHYSNL